MEQKRARTTALVMMAVAMIFVIFAFTHPQSSWPWNNAVSYALYGVYLVTMVGFGAAALKLKSKTKVLIVLAAAAVVLAVYLYYLWTMRAPKYLYFRF